MVVPPGWPVRKWARGQGLGSVGCRSARLGQANEPGTTGVDARWWSVSKAERSANEPGTTGVGARWRSVSKVSGKASKALGAKASYRNLLIDMILYIVYYIIYYLIC